MEITKGSRVRIKNDGDGADSSLGTIRNIYKSGRFCVDLDCGGFRNLGRDQMEAIDAAIQIVKECK